jgi:hypothetical protein
MRKQLARFRVHLIFGGAMLVWFLLSVIPDMLDGQRFIPAVWTAIKGVRPLEWVMGVCFWLVLAFPQKTETSNPTILGL